MPFQKGHPQYNTGKTWFKKGHLLNNGKKLSEEHKRKLSESHKGKIPSNAWKKGIHISPRTEFKKGIIPWNWKGDKAGYDALHDWVKRRKGKALICINCESTNRVEWSNISYEYKRNLDDYEALCHKCHFKKDREFWGVIKKVFPNNGKK